MPRSILILGAGIAGLCSALALSGKGHTITLIEKDPPPPEGGADVAFADWKHAGVGHLRHSHAFLARLRTLIKASHPALLDALAAAGCRELKFADGLPEPMREIYRPAPGDDDLAVLTSRRTTLELVIRRYVEGLEGVEIRSGLIVKEVLIEGAGRRGAWPGSGSTASPRARFAPTSPSTRADGCRMCPTSCARPAR